MDDKSGAPRGTASEAIDTASAAFETATVVL